MRNETLNAKITGTKLGEDHGCLTAYIYVEGAGWGGGMGGYCLDHWCSEVGHYGSSDGYGAIIELMKTIEVDKWEDLKGKYVRVHVDEHNTIDRIGHLMKDKWFSFKEYIEKVKEIKGIVEE